MPPSRVPPARRLAARAATPVSGWAFRSVEPRTASASTWRQAAGGSKNKSDGRDTTWNNTHVQAGGNLTMNSGGDTVLRGAQASADLIMATVGGNLVGESLQDISHYAARDRSVGVQVSLCIPPLCYGANSVSGNYGHTKINSQNLKSDCMVIKGSIDANALQKSPIFPEPVDFWMQGQGISTSLRKSREG
nr:hemagglutinin repeat-containing protein [Achromobacter spanius]